jgi:hypothetical protein
MLWHVAGARVKSKFSPRQPSDTIWNPAPALFRQPPALCDHPRHYTTLCSKAGSTCHTPFAYPKREYSVQSSSFSSAASIFLHPSSPISHTPNQLPPMGPTFFFFYPHRSQLLPILCPFPLHSPTSPRLWTSRRRVDPATAASQWRTSLHRPPAPTNRRSAGPHRPSPALCGVRRWASRLSRRRQPVVPSSDAAPTAVVE